MDEVVRRMAQAIQDRDPVLLQHRGDIALKYAEAALATLKPGDDLGNNLFVGRQDIQQWEFILSKRYQAVKDMRERAWCAAVGAFRPKDKSDDYCDGYFQGRKEAGDSVLALSYFGRIGESNEKVNQAA